MSSPETTDRMQDPDPKPPSALFRWAGEPNRSVRALRPGRGRRPAAASPPSAWHYLAPTKGWFVVLTLVATAVGVFESSLYLLIGWFVDLLTDGDPATILETHGLALLLVGLFVLVMRPGAELRPRRGQEPDPGGQFHQH